MSASMVQHHPKAPKDARNVEKQTSSQQRSLPFLRRLASCNVSKAAIACSPHRSFSAMIAPAKRLQLGAEHLGNCGFVINGCCPRRRKLRRGRHKLCYKVLLACQFFVHRAPAPGAPWVRGLPEELATTHVSDWP